MNDEETRAPYTELRSLSTTFYDKSKEKSFYEKNSQFRLITRFFGFLTLLYGIANLTLIILKSINTQNNNYYAFNNQSNEVVGYILFALIFLTFILNFVSKEYSGNIYFSVLYFQFILFSCSHFLMGGQLIAIKNQKLGNIQNNTNTDTSSGSSSENNSGSTPSNIYFIFLLSDCLIKFIWVLTPLNNFIFLLFAMIISTALSIFFLSMNNFLGEIYQDYFFITYIIFCFFLIFGSKKILKLKKLIFLQNYSRSGTFSITHSNIFSKVKNLNSGYLSKSKFEFK